MSFAPAFLEAPSPARRFRDSRFRRTKYAMPVTISKPSAAASPFRGFASERRVVERSCHESFFRPVRACTLKDTPRARYSLNLLRRRVEPLVRHPPYGLRRPPAQVEPQDGGVGRLEAFVVVPRDAVLHEPELFVKRDRIRVVRLHVQVRVRQKRVSRAFVERVSQEARADGAIAMRRQHAHGHHVKQSARAVGEELQATRDGARELGADVRQLRRAARGRALSVEFILRRREGAGG